MIWLHFPAGPVDLQWPRVFAADGAELQDVTEVTLLPGGLCRCVRLEQPLRLEGGEAATITIEDRYTVTVEDTP